MEGDFNPDPTKPPTHYGPIRVESFYREDGLRVVRVLVSGGSHVLSDPIDVERAAEALRRVQTWMNQQRVTPGLTPMPTDTERLDAMQEYTPEILTPPDPCTTDGNVFELFVCGYDGDKGRSYYGDDLAEACDQMIEGERRHKERRREQARADLRAQGIEPAGDAA